MTLRTILPFQIVRLFSHYIRCLRTLPLTLFLDFGHCLVELGSGFWLVQFAFLALDLSLLDLLWVFFPTWETGLIGSGSGSCVGNPRECYLGLVKPH